MGLESASMRQCLLWYNFIVWGMRTAGPKTQTDPWYGGFSVLLETAMCVESFGLDVLFLICRLFERQEQKGGGGGEGVGVSLMPQIRREVGHTQLMNRTIKSQVSVCGFMWQDKKFLISDAISPKILQPPGSTAAALHGGTTTTTRSYSQRAARGT